MSLKYRNALARLIAVGELARTCAVQQMLHLQDIREAIQAGRIPEARTRLDESWRVYWGLVAEHPGWRCLERDLNSCEIAISFEVDPPSTGGTCRS